MSHLAGTATHTHQSREHDWQATEELAAAFDRLAKDDPEIRIDGTGAHDRTMDLSLGAGPAHPESTRDFDSHAIDAARLFDPNGKGDPVDRWLSLVWKHAPERITADLLGGTIEDGARVSALVVRRLRGVAAMRMIAEQQVRDAADRVRDLSSLLTWAFTLSLAGWRHSDRPAGRDVERLCPEGRDVHDWLLREIGARTGLDRADLDVARATRRGSAADELGQLHRDDSSYLGWLIDGVHERFPGAVEYLHLKPGTSDVVPTGPTTKRDDSAFVMAMMTGGGGMVMTDAQGREVAAGQIADRLAELNAHLAAKPAERGDGWADVPDDARLSSREIAEKAGVPHHPLRKRLDRWRSKNPDQSGAGWFEVSDRKSKDPQFLYCVGAVRAIVSASSKRPAK